MSNYYCSHNPPCCPKVDTLESERDRLKAELEMAWERMTEEKAKAERLAEALRDIENDKRTPPVLYQEAVHSFFMAIRLRAKEALAEYSATLRSDSKTHLEEKGE